MRNSNSGVLCISRRSTSDSSAYRRRNASTRGVAVIITKPRPE